MGASWYVMSVVLTQEHLSTIDDKKIKTSTPHHMCQQAIPGWSVEQGYVNQGSLHYLHGS